ncbi:CBS domain-containing protein [Methanobrevibacter sp. DSM 116169]|uniref:CBS domain-containing protein n=1 Tax=Methanobrevibacter sp. DSM 116169 TaxID=3242727 RepID=UPI0038FCE365
MLVKKAMSKKVVSVSVPGNREKALEIIRKKNISAIPVVKGDSTKLVGLITRSDLITNPDEEQIAMLMSRDLITVKPDDDLKVAAERMVDNDIRRIPVVNDDFELVGIITSFDIVSIALTKLDIEDSIGMYMQKAVPTTWDETPLNVAFEIMKQFGLKTIIGLNSSGKLSSILTETDFIEESEIISEKTEHSSTVGTEGDKWSWDSTSVLYIEKNHLKFTDKVVKDVSPEKVDTANTKTKVSECAKKMKAGNFEQIPVLDVEGELVGIVRASDLVKALL